MLTESQVQTSFRKLVHTPVLDEEAIEKADELLVNLRPESPLYHRLSSELEELRQKMPSNSS